MDIATPPSPTGLIAELPVRLGPRPRTGPAVPHEQLDQIGPPDLGEDLWRRMTELDGATGAHSLISAPSSRAIHLRHDLASGPDEAFIVGTEFAHLHGAHDGSLHVALPRDVVAIAFAHGWAELHPIAAAGGRPPTLAMLYAPRDEQELEVIWMLVGVSHRFARG